MCLLLSVRLLPTMRLLRLRIRYCRVQPGLYLHSDNEHQDYLARLGVSAKILFVRQFAHRGEAEEKRASHYNEEHDTAEGKDSGLRHRQSFFGNAWTRKIPNARIDGTQMPTKMPFSRSSIAPSLAKYSHTLKTKLAKAASSVVMRRMVTGFMLRE